MLSKAHEESSFIDRRLRKRERRKDKQLNHWKEGWAEEVERKFSSREIEMLHEGNNIEISANNKFLMECTRAHVEATKGKKKM